MAWYVTNNNMTHNHTFRNEHIPKEIKKFIGNKNIITNIRRMQGYDSIANGYFSTRRTGFMFNGKSLTDFTNLFSSHDFQKNDKIILEYFLE